MLRTVIAAVAASLMSVSSFAQDSTNPSVEPPATTPSELLLRLRDRGVEVPDDVQTLADGSVVVPPAPAPEPQKKWRRKLIELSLTYAEGNTENLGFRVFGEAIRETDNDFLRLRTQYFYAENDGDEENNEGFFIALYDRQIADSKWVYFAEGRYDYNEFEDWLHRVNAGGGLGYHFYDQDDLKFIGRAGAAATREFDSPNDDVMPELFVGFDLEWQITPSQSLEITNRDYIDVDSGDEFRVLTQGAYRLNMDSLFEGAVFSIGVNHEYETDVGPGTRRSDVQVFISLGVNF